MTYNFECEEKVKVKGKDYTGVILGRRQGELPGRNYYSVMLQRECVIEGKEKTINLLKVEFLEGDLEKLVNSVK